MGKHLPYPHEIRPLRRLAMAVSTQLADRQQEHGSTDRPTKT